jgi:cell shape-determining protein MreD
LWAAYGWAAEDESGWRAPVTLTVLGLLHDQLAGGPYGLFAVLYLAAYLVGRGAAVIMSAPNLISLWGGFIFTTLVTVAIAAIIAPLALGDNVSILPYAEAATITAILFPLVRPLYMSAAPSMRPQPGLRR